MRVCVYANSYGDQQWSFDGAMKNSNGAMKKVINGVMILHIAILRQTLMSKKSKGELNLRYIRNKKIRLLKY